MKKRPTTTLFMLASVDGKISPGASDLLDVDQDFPTISGLKEGLHQYYEIEQTTDLWSLHSGRVHAKLGINESSYVKNKRPLSFVVIDNHHLTAIGVDNLVHCLKQVVIVTSNKQHPAYSLKTGNLTILPYEQFSPQVLLEELYTRFSCTDLTIQTGGTLNSLFLREKVIDQLDLVLAPVLVGGKETVSLVDGEALQTKADLHRLGVMKLIAVEALQDSYVRLRYQMNEP